MKSTYMNDSLNLRDLIEQITDYARINDLEPKNARSFLLTLFSGIKASDITSIKKKVDNQNKEKSNKGKKKRNSEAEESIDDTLLLFLQKLLSGNIPMEMLASLSAAVLDDRILAILDENLSPIVDSFSRTTDCFSFFLRLSQQTSPRFFLPEEISALKASLYDYDYHRFLMDLIVHGFKMLHNIPAYYCERLESEALTYDFDNPVRFELLKEAAKYNKRAALEYGNYLAKKGPYDQAFHYMMDALPMPAAIWNISFLIETHRLSQINVKQYKNAIRFEEKIAPEAVLAFPELTDIICVVKVPEYDDLVCAFKSYAYLAGRSYFFKAYNSMAKLLSTKAFSLQPGSKYSKEKLIAGYFRRAIEGSTPPALNNTGGALLDKLESGIIGDDDDYEQDLLRECLQTASNCGMANAAYKLARYMEYSSSASHAAIVAQYERAITLDADETKTVGLSYFSLGELEKQSAKKIDYYKKAAGHGNENAILKLAMEYYDQMIHGDYPESWLSELNSLYSQYDSIMTESVRDKVMNVIEKAIEWHSNDTIAASPN